MLGMGWAVRTTIICLLAAVSLMANLTTAHTATPTVATTLATANGDIAGLFDIGGRSLYLECRGEGSPTVILEAGAGNNGETWDTIGLSPDQDQTAVFPGVASFTRVCVYDRPGTIRDFTDRSRSDPAPMPRTAGEIVADLHALLSAADVPGPYVFAGHSFGGLVARLYAATYPEEVVGLVLIDAAHEDYYAAMYDALTPELREAMATMATEGPPELADYAARERLDTVASADQLRAAAAATPLRPMPLIVLTHGRPWDWPSGYPAAALEAVWEPLQTKLAALTPDGRLVVAEQSGHFIPGDEPDVVIDAIQEVVAAVRDSDAQVP